MVVKMQSNRRGVTGLHIGTRNVRRYFRHGQSTIELEMDHLQIQCRLEPSFWNGKPNISDPRLCAWLEAKGARENAYREGVSLSMIPVGEETFRLKICPRAKKPTATRPLKEIA